MKMTVGDLRQALAHLAPTQTVLIGEDETSYYVGETIEDYDPDGFFVLEKGEEL